MVINTTSMSRGEGRHAALTVPKWSHLATVVISDRSAELSPAYLATEKTSGVYGHVTWEALRSLFQGTTMTVCSR